MAGNWTRLAGALVVGLVGVEFASATGTARFYYADLSFDGYANADVTAVAINNRGEYVGVRELSGPYDALPWRGEISEPIAMVPGVSFMSAAPSALNESGQFAGVGTRPNLTKTVYRYTPGVGEELLGNLNGVSGWAVDINAAGDVAGTWSILGGPYMGGRAFRYTDAGGFRALPTLGGHDASAVDMNDSGVIVGTSRVGGTLDWKRACYWLGEQCLPLGPDNVWSQATHVNNAGLILGYYIDSQQNTQSFIQQVGGAWQSVPRPEGATSARAFDINELGQIVGISDLGAYIYTPGSGAQIVDITFTPSMLSNTGHVVGFALEPPYVNKAWYWSPETGSVRLDDVIVPPLPWSVSSVVGFNDRDEILANGEYHGYSVASVVFPTKAGDLNCDGVVDFFDIDPFVAALGGQVSYDAAYPNCNWPSADANDDGVVDFFDIDPFVALLGS